MLLLAAALLQVPGPAPAPAQVYEPPAAWVERVRRELEKEPVVALQPRRRDIPTFRVVVNEWALRVDRPWMDQKPLRPDFVQTPAPSVHHEFLTAVVPEDYRGATLYPIGIPMRQVVEFLGGKWNAAVRKRRESRAKREVEDALRQFLAETGQAK